MEIELAPSLRFAAPQIQVDCMEVCRPLSRGLRLELSAPPPSPTFSSSRSLPPPSFGQFLTSVLAKSPFTVANKVKGVEKAHSDFRLSAQKTFNTPMRDDMDQDEPLAKKRGATRNRRGPYKNKRSRVTMEDLCFEIESAAKLTMKRRRTSDALPFSSRSPCQMVTPGLSEDDAMRELD